VNLKARFPKKIKNSLSLLRDDEKVFLDGGGVVKKMPLGQEEDRGLIAKNALGNLPSKKRTR
jgi:hypothetical protein